MSGAKKSGAARPGRARGCRSLKEILEKNAPVCARLKPGADFPRDAFIILAERLSPKQKQALTTLSEFVVDTDGDLLGRLAALERENAQLKSLSLSDDLTGLYNRRFFTIQLEIEMARSRRTGQPCCLMIIDFDNFKDINDRLGHDEGDRFLIQMAGLLREKLRPTDFVCRYGGDEFAVIMPATSLLDGIGIARRLREFTSQFTWKMAFRVSASFGIAEFDPQAPLTAEEFFQQADKELYRAKRGGKNRVCHPTQGARRTQPEPVDRLEREALFQLQQETKP